MAQFGSSIRNIPDANGRVTTRGKIKYHFKILGILSVVLVEAKLKIGSVEDRLNAVAEVIAECDGQASLEHRISH